MKKFIDVHVPISACNFNCKYCYVAHEGNRNQEKTFFKYDIDTIKKALSSERLGGICHFNVCGEGETLIPKEIVPIVRVMLENGHYVMIVTNGTLKNRFLEFSKFPLELRKHLGFKFSFHYMELMEKGMFDIFNENVELVKNSGMSYSIEMTPTDELEPYIDEIIAYCNEHYGAPCHVTIPRNMNTNNIELLSKHSIDEFYNIWKKFDSPLLDFKYELWGIKRTEYCYAGVWSGLLNISNGDFSSCYTGKIHQNIFEHVDKPINFIAIGCNCKLPHCYNGHSFLSMGNIPELNCCTYNQLRDRVTSDNNHWLNDDMRYFLSERLDEDNTIWNNKQKINNQIKKNFFYIKTIINKIYSGVNNENRKNK